MELKRCLEILELKNATSMSQVKLAYRELARVWHPDRFHANPQKKQRAEKKMREINMAYEKLIAFLSSAHGTDKLSLLSPKTAVTPGLDRQANSRAVRQKTGTTRTGDRSTAAGPGVTPVGRTAPSARATRSPIGKLVALGLCIILAAASVFLVNYLLTIDHSIHEGQRATSLTKRLVLDSPKNKTAGNIERDERIQNGKSAKKKKTHQSSDTFNYFEIYLKGGGSLITKTWWKERDMIMYKTKYGTMGVEITLVEKIIAK
jgi:hypothetical protein